MTLQRARLRDRGYLLGLIALWVVPPLLIATVAGTLTIPQNDDALYRRAALSLYEAGHLEPVGFWWTSLIGQLLVTQPILWISRGEPWAFLAVGIVAACIAVIAGYWLARRLVTPRRAVLALVTLIVFPGVWLTTTTYMTDIPALGAQLACLALGAMGLRAGGKGRRWWLIASLAVGLIGFGIRDFGLAAPFAVFVATAASRRDSTRFYLAAGAASFVAAVLIYLVSTRLPGHGSSPMDPSPLSLLLSATAFATLALALSPVLVVSAATWRRRLHRRDMILGAVGPLILVELVAMVFVQTGTYPRVLVGNLLQVDGAMGQSVLSGLRPDLFPRSVWDLVDLAALAAAVCAGALIVGIIGSVWRSRGDVRGPLRRRLGSVSGLLALFVATYGGGLVLYATVGGIFDRYLWPLVVPMSVLLLMRPPMPERVDAAGRRGRPVGLPARALASVLIAAIGTLSLAVTLNAASFSAGRWRLGEDAARLGIPVESIDSGYEWVATYAPAARAPAAPAPASPSPGTDVPGDVGMWYYAGWPSFTPCAMVSSSKVDRPDARLEKTETYRMLLVTGAETPLYLYRLSNEGCP